MFRNKCKDLETMQSYFKISLLIGLTGSGKSSLANGLSGEIKFRTSNSTESETSNVDCFVTNFFGDQDQENVIVVDTPGIGDTRHIDSTHIHNIVKSLKIIGYVNSFVIVINSENPRFDEQL